MTEPLRQASAPLYGRQNWFYIPACAGYATGVAPTVAEMTAGSAFDMTRTAFADAAPNPTKNTNVVDQNPRFGDTTLGQFIGKTTLVGGDIKYAFDPQAAAGSNGKKMWELLGAGADVITSGFLVRRQNVPRATAIAIGQFLEVYKADISRSIPMPDGDGEAAEGGAICTFVITDPAFLANVAITA